MKKNKDPLALRFLYLFYFLHPRLPLIPPEKESVLPQSAREYHAEKLSG